MIIQGTNHRGDVVDRADVVVVGTGAGGGTLAAYLADRGWDVVMVERGGFHRAEDFSQREDEGMALFNGRRGLDATVDNGIALSYAEAVGGTTVHYWGDSFRAPEDRLQRWRAERGLDWMTPSELDPHYQAIERELGIHVAGEELFNENNRLVRLGCERLGWHGAAVPTARIDCIACGWTQFGCTYNRKTSQLITTIPRVSRAGGRVYSDALIDTIEIEGGRARGVTGALLDRASGAAHSRIRVRADAVVLAGGALGTAELLLRGLDDPTVGRRFYVNPSFFLYADFGRVIDNVTGIPCAYAVHEFRTVRHDDRGRYAGGGYLMLSNHQPPGLTAALLSDTGLPHAERMRRYRQLGSLMSIIDEDHPGRVFLDRSGVRKTEYRLRGVDREKAVDFLRNAARILLAAGAREAWVPDIHGTTVRDEREVEALITASSVDAGAQICAGTHLLGTAPLGADPVDAFAGPTGESHRVPGLYVADGAAVPGSVSVDPAHTIMAVARWIAASLHERSSRAGA